jgi:hypothetical protein
MQLDLREKSYFLDETLPHKSLADFATAPMKEHDDRVKAVSQRSSPGTKGLVTSEEREPRVEASDSKTGGHCQRDGSELPCRSKKDVAPRAAPRAAPRKQHQEQLQGQRH